MQPVIIEDTISIAAGATNENVLVSNPSLRGVVRAPFAARGGLAAVQSATGLTFSFDYGSKNVVANSNARVTTSSPDDPLDVVNDEWYCSEGDQLVLRAVNTGGGAVVLRYRLVLIPLAMPGQLVQLPPDTRVIQQGPIAIATQLVDFQLLDGLRYERAPVDCSMEIFMTQSASGLLRSVFIDMERIAPPSAISLNNRIPQDPFDMTVQGVEVGADQLIQLQVSNPTGGSLNVFWKMKLEELERT